MPTFSTPGPISASVEISIGDVRITASPRDETSVEVAPSSPTVEADVRAADQTRVELADGTLRVLGPKNWRAIGPTKRTGSVQVVIALPAGSDVEATTSLGGITGVGRLGRCRIRTSAGDIRLQEAAGVDLKTGIGAIEADRVSGELVCSTGSGSVRIAEVDGPASVKNSNGDTWLGEVRGDLRIKAANGEIAVDRARADVHATTANGGVRVGCLERGQVELKTAAGQVDVGILAGTAARLDLHTSFGGVHNQLDATDRPEPTESTVEVRAQTGYGDIVIRRALAGAS